MFVAQLGESANTLVNNWQGGYRYGFPSFYAAGFPVRPMRYDQSRIYSGVIGRQYEDSTNRYNYMFDPNMYEQPGIPSGIVGLGIFDPANNRMQGGLVIGTITVTTLLILGSLIVTRRTPVAAGIGRRRRRRSR